jgi:hypothetical protein
MMPELRRHRRQWTCKRSLRASERLCFWALLSASSGSGGSAWRGSGQMPSSRSAPPGSSSSRRRSRAITVRPGSLLRSFRASAFSARGYPSRGHQCARSQHRGDTLVLGYGGDIRRRRPTDCERACRHLRDVYEPLSAADCSAHRQAAARGSRSRDPLLRSRCVARAGKRRTSAPCFFRPPRAQGLAFAG